MTDKLPATDNRSRVRIWDKKWNCIVDERVQPGDRLLTDLIERALKRVNITEANVTFDDEHGNRSCGYASLNPAQSGVEIIDHEDVKQLTQWPDGRGGYC